MKKSSSRLYIRPKDSSYEAYANMIKTMCEHFGVPFEDDEKLRESYKRLQAKRKSLKAAESSPKQAAPKRVTRLKKKS